MEVAYASSWTRRRARRRSNVLSIGVEHLCDVAWHPDGTGCLTAGSNFKLTYWDGLDGENVRCVDGSHTAWMTTLDVDPEHGAYYVTGLLEHSTVKVWSYDEGVATAEGVAHSKAVNAVRISPDQNAPSVLETRARSRSGP